MTTPVLRHAPAPVHPHAKRVSPFEVAVAGDGARTAVRSKPDLFRQSRAAERRAQVCGPGDLVLVAVQDVRFWTRRTREVYARIAGRGATVVAFGAGLPTDLTAGLHKGVATVGIAEDDLLADEWLVLICTSRARWGFVSRDAAAGLPGVRSGPQPVLDGRLDEERTFVWADLQDPVWLERAAAVLLTRVPSLAASVPWLAR